MRRLLFTNTNQAFIRGAELAVNLILTPHQISMSMPSHWPLHVILIRSASSSGRGASLCANALKQLRQINQSHPATELGSVTFDSLL